MSIPIIDQLRPLGNFPAVDASDVQAGNERLSTRLSNTPTTTYVDAVVENKVDKVEGKGLSTNDYTNAEKNKLSGIEANANNYVHPTTAGNKHIPSGGSAGKILGWAADGTAQWVDDHNTEYSDATTSTHGLMSAADKAKLNGIASEATNVTVDASLSGSSTNAIQNKAVYDALALKANTSDVNTSLATKADSSVVSSLAGRVSDVETEQTALGARMDTFTNLAEGSTTGDAELADIRVEADGTTANSAGAAVRDQITDLKSVSNQLFHEFDKEALTEFNLIDDYELSRFTDGEYVDRSGAKASVPNYTHTDYVMVLPSTKYSVNVSAHVVFYDKDHKYISGTLTKQQAGGVTYTATVTTPANCVFMIVSTDLSKKNTICIVRGEAEKSYAIGYCRNILDFDEEGNSTIKPFASADTSKRLLKAKTLIKEYTTTDGYYYYYSNGSKAALEKMCYTELISCKPSTVYCGYKLNGGAHVCFYDNNGTYISGVLISQPGSGTAYGNEFKTPSNCMFFRLSFEKVNKNNVYIIELSYRSNEAHTTKKKMTDYVITNNCYYVFNSGNKGYNESMCFTELIGCKPNTEYTTFSVGDAHICFYDINGDYLSGTLCNQTYSDVTYGNTFTTPDNCYFVRVSIKKTNKADSAIVESAYTAPDSPTPYRFIVDQNGGGDFTTVSAAVSAASDNDYIFIKSGEYEETIGLSENKNIHLVGENRLTTVIYNTDGNYKNAPILMGGGSLENLTMSAKRTQSSSPSGNLSYGVHIERSSLYEGELLIRDCIITSDFNAALGMGMRGKCNILIENCDFIHYGSDRALYFHDSDANSQLGEQNITVRNCRMSVAQTTTNGILCLQSQEKDGSIVNVTFQNNFIRTKSGSTSVKHYNYYGGTSTDPNDYLGLINWRLTDMSYGNNVSDLNAD